MTVSVQRDLPRSAFARSGDDTRTIRLSGLRLRVVVIDDPVFGPAA